MVVLFVLAWNLVRGRMGRAMIAVRDQEIAASTVGVSLAGTKVGTFAISAAYAGIAGSLSVMVDRLADGTSAILYFQRSIEFLVAMTIGGAATILGPAVGALVLVHAASQHPGPHRGQGDPGAGAVRRVAHLHRVRAARGAGRRRPSPARPPRSALVGYGKAADPSPILTTAMPRRATMLRSRRTRVAASLLALALLGAACSSRDDDDDETSTGGDDEAAASSDISTEDCVSDPTQEIEGDTIKLASSYPQSGQYAAYSEIARGWKAFFDKVNAEGGVEVGDRTFQIEYEDQDDQYNAGETAANIDEMVGPEGDGAFAVFSVVGTANNVAIRDTLNELCVPEPVRRHRLAGVGQPRLPVDDRLDADRRTRSRPRSSPTCSAS